MIVSPKRETMNNKLRMYNFPRCTFSNIKHFITKNLENKLWVKCLAEFLTEIKFYKKTEDAHITETLENP